MISRRIVLCSLAALLSLAVFSYAQRAHAGKRCMSDHTTAPCDHLSTSPIPTVSCVAPIFPRCLVDDSPMIRCGDSAAFRNCVKEILQQRTIAVGSSEFESAVHECVDEIADEYDDKDTRADCYTEVCTNVTARLSAATDLESIFMVRSRCIQEFVLMPKMNRTAVGRVVNNFVQQCKQDQGSLEDIDGAVANCMQVYVQTCFERKSPRTLEQCIDDAESMCETVRNACKDDAENI